MLVRIGVLLVVVAGPVRALVAQDRPGGAIIGFVTAKETGQRLPYADLLLDERRAAFADERGRFEYKEVPAGVAHVRVRRIGFDPITVPVTVTSGRTDTIRVELAALALQLDKVRSTDAVCPNRARNTVDTAVFAILQQLTVNAERNRLLVREYPFESSVERSFDGHWKDVAMRVDTIVLPSEHDWRYAPGNLVIHDADRNAGGGGDVMMVPQLADFADEPFMAAHCFRYAGLEKLDGRAVARIDFEPTRDIREPDVSGSLYLDAAGFQIQRSLLVLKIPSPSSSVVTETRIDTWFRDVVPGVPVIDRIEAKTTDRDIQGRRPSGPAAVEKQRLIDLRFLDRRP